MLRLPKLYLLLSSVCLFLSCSISKYKSKINTVAVPLSHQLIVPVVNQDGNSSKFKASIDVLNKHFTGLVVVKKTDSLSTHIVFVTELGMKMFDLEKRDTSYNMVYVFEPLNKPSLISVLTSNFKNMLLLDVEGREAQAGITAKQQKVYKINSNKNHRFFVTDTLNRLSTQAIFHRNKRSSKITYTNAPLTYSQINSIQYGLVKIKIELTRITD